MGHAHDARDGCNVRHEIETEPIVERRVGRIRSGGQKERIAIGGSLGDCLGSNVSRGAPSVLDHKWLVEPLGEPLANQTCGNVGAPTGCIADDQSHRPRRIRLRPSEAPDGRERESARGQMQKMTAGELHGATQNTTPAASLPARKTDEDYWCLV
jgi:hypothetical protein